MFRDDEVKMIDELLTIFLAGSKTVQISTNNLLCYLNEYPEVKAKLLNEIDGRIKSIGGDTEGPSFDYDLAEEFDYVRQCFYETNRIEGPIMSSAEQCFSKDVRLENGMTFAKGDFFMILIDGMHNNPEEWQQPDKFIPERFDPQSKFFARPDGGQRHPLSFNPFFGGQRVCLGKTFAEVMVRFTVPILLWHYDFELVDKNYMKGHDRY
jgi:cytochrome P450